MKTKQTKPEPEQNQKPSLAYLLKRAAHYLDDADPVEAVVILDEALKIKTNLDTHKRIEKIHEEASLGSVEKAATLLEMLWQFLPKLSCAEAGRMGGQTGGKATSKAKTEAARRNAKKGGRPRKPLANLTAGEDSAYSSAFEHYMNNVKQDTARADRYAWRETVKAFPRLKAFGGATP